MTLPLTTRLVRVDSPAASGDVGDAYALVTWETIVPSVRCHLGGQAPANLGDRWQSVDGIVYLPPGTPITDRDRIVDLTDGTVYSVKVITRYVGLGLDRINVGVNRVSGGR